MEYDGTFASKHPLISNSLNRPFCMHVGDQDIVADVQEEREGWEWWKVIADCFSFDGFIQD